MPAAAEKPVRNSPGNEKKIARANADALDLERNGHLRLGVETAVALAIVTFVPKRSELGISATLSVCRISSRISASLALASTFTEKFTF